MRMDKDEKSRYIQPSAVSEKIKVKPSSVVGFSKEKYPLHAAIKKYDLDAFRYFVEEEKRDVNLLDKDGATPLIFTCIRILELYSLKAKDREPIDKIYAEMLRCLIRNGATVDKPITSYIHNYGGRFPIQNATPLNLLCCSDLPHFEFIKILVDAGADLNREFFIKIPLRDAMSKRSLQSILDFYDRGLNSSNPQRVVESIEYMLTHGANPKLFEIKAKNVSKFPNNIQQMLLEPGKTALVSATNDDNAKQLANRVVRLMSADVQLSAVVGDKLKLLIIDAIKTSAIPIRPGEAEGLADRHSLGDKIKTEIYPCVKNAKDFDESEIKDVIKEAIMVWVVSRKMTNNVSGMPNSGAGSSNNFFKEVVKESAKEAAAEAGKEGVKQIFDLIRS